MTNLQLLFLILCGIALLVAALLLWTRIRPLVVVWDLDHTLVHSARLVWTMDLIDGIVDPNKQQILRRGLSYLDHVDDDAILFRSYVRGGALRLLRILRFLGARQSVFTSATKGYMDNIVDGLLDPDGNIFHSRFAREFCEGRRRRKNLEFARLDSEHVERFWSRVVLVDDMKKSVCAGQESNCWIVENWNSKSAILMKEACSALEVPKEGDERRRRPQRLPSVAAKNDFDWEFFWISLKLISWCLCFRDVRPMLRAIQAKKTE